MPELPEVEGVVRDLAPECDWENDASNYLFQISSLSKQLEKKRLLKGNLQTILFDEMEKMTIVENVMRRVNIFIFI